MAWGLLGGDMLRKATVDTTNALTFQGNSNAPTSGGVTDGLTASGFYNNSNTPCSYSNVINIKGDKGGCSQLALGWSDSDNGIEHLYYRNKRDCCDTWSEWRTVAFTTDTVANANYASVAGAVTFASIGDVATSNKITWNGSTDGADIYYETKAADQGNLVINLRDDANCYLQIAQNGNYKSYFSPADGNFHGNVNGNVNGNASTAGVAAKLGHNGNTNAELTFNASVAQIDPTKMLYLWGGLGGGGNQTYELYRASDLSVNYAATAGSATNSNVVIGNGYMRIGAIQICYGQYQSSSGSLVSVAFAQAFKTVNGITLTDHTAPGLIYTGFRSACVASLTTTGFVSGRVDEAPVAYYIAIGTWG